MAEKFGVDHDKWVHGPKKLRSSDMFEGGDASRKTVFFPGSALTPAEDKITLKVSSSKNMTRFKI